MSDSFRIHFNENRQITVNENLLDKNCEYKAHVNQNTILQEGEYEILKLKLGIEYSKYEPGDILEIKPKNYNIKELVEYIIILIYMKKKKIFMK